MLHLNTKSLVDVIAQENADITLGYSPSFSVVSEGNLKGLRAKRACLAVKTTAVGSVTVQFYYKRVGMEVSLLTAPIVLDTSNQYVQTTDFTNTVLVVGDLLYARVMAVSGTAKGLTLSVDFN